MATKKKNPGGVAFSLELSGLDGIDSKDIQTDSPAQIPSVPVGDKKPPAVTKQAAQKSLTDEESTVSAKEDKVKTPKKTAVTEDPSKFTGRDDLKLPGGLYWNYKKTHNCSSALLISLHEDEIMRLEFILLELEQSDEPKPSIAAYLITAIAAFLEKRASDPKNYRPDLPPTNTSSTDTRVVFVNKKFKRALKLATLQNKKRKMNYGTRAIEVFRNAVLPKLEADETRLGIDTETYLD